jgi:hypothetical protein
VNHIFVNQNNIFYKKLNSYVFYVNWKKPVNCCTWSIALCGAETWTLRAVGQERLERFEMWCWRRMEKFSWTDYMRNEVLLRVKEQRNILHEISKRKANWIVICFVETAFYDRLLKER